MRVVSRFVAAAGVSLHVESCGEGSPVVILHGFTGSTVSVAGVAAGLCDRHRAIRVDLVGHGKSDAPRDVSRYRMESCVEQLAGVVRALDAAPAHLLGYSMGGRVALAVCALRPEIAASATLVGARAGIEDRGEREARIRRDRALADRIESEGVPRFVAHWMALPLFASQERLGEEALAAAREQRLANRAHGLANSLRGMGAGAQPPFHERLGAIGVPVLLAVGEEDARFRAVAEELGRRLPAARVAVIPGAGHAAHLENPSAFLRAARLFLEEVDAGRRGTTTPEPSPAHVERIPSP